MLLQTFPSSWEVWELQHHDKCHRTGADWAGSGVAPQPFWGVQLSLDPSSQSSGPRADPEQSWDCAQEPPLPPQLMGPSHVLVRKSSPNLSVKGIHCQQVAWTLCHFVTSHVTDAESPFSAFMFPSPFLGKAMKVVLLYFDKACFHAALLSWGRESGIYHTEQLYGSFWSMCRMDLAWEHV